MSIAFTKNFMSKENIDKSTVKGSVFLKILMGFNKFRNRKIGKAILAKL